MTYLDGDRERYRIAQNAEEETQAATAGYLRTANPPDPNYRKLMIEDPQKKRWDYRGVLLHSQVEEAQWRAAIKVEDWIEDPTRQWGARPVGLTTLVQEYKETRKRRIDSDTVGPETVSNNNAAARSTSE
jgi:hypothetical protein